LMFGFWFWREERRENLWERRRRNDITTTTYIFNRSVFERDRQGKEVQMAENELVFVTPRHAGSGYSSDTEVLVFGSGGRRGKEGGTCGD
jgi:hypothetical protein